MHAQLNQIQIAKTCILLPCEMIYQTGSDMWKRFVRKRFVTSKPYVPRNYPWTPTSKNDYSTVDMQTQAMAMIAGERLSVLSDGSGEGGGFCCACYIPKHCDFCGRECVKPMDQDPVIRALYKAFLQQRSFLCSRCRKTRYCSRACQKNDWSNHRPHCNDWGL